MLISDWRREKPDLEVEPMGIVGRILQLGRILEKRAGVALKGFDIHYTDLDVLATLRRSGKPFQLTPTELRKSVLITSGAMTTLLNRLQKKELVKRVPDEEDGRVLAVALTSAGVNLIDQAIVVRFQEAASAAASLSPQEQAELGHLLKKMILSLETP